MIEIPRNIKNYINENIDKVTEYVDEINNWIEKQAN